MTVCKSGYYKNASTIGRDETRQRTSGKYLFWQLHTLPGTQFSAGAVAL